MSAVAFIRRCLAVGMDLETTLLAAEQFEAQPQASDLTPRQARNQRYYEAKKRLNASEASEIKTPKTVQDEHKTVKTVSAPSRTSAQVVTLTSSLRSEAYTPVSPNGLTAPRAETARGSRIPENWSPVPDYDPAAYGLSHAQHDAELAKFLDYWRSVPGAKGRKTDWPATWRNWMRRASETQPRKAHDRPHSPAATAPGRAARRGVWAEVLAEERGATTGFGD